MNGTFEFLRPVHCSTLSMDSIRLSCEQSKIESAVMIGFIKLPKIIPFVELKHTSAGRLNYSVGSGIGCSHVRSHQ